MVKLPRFMIAAPTSGQGKTMATVSLMSALTKRGLSVAPNKVGPDYIDPGYHSLVTGRVSRNLDPVLCPPELICPLLLAGATTPNQADVAIIEGVMGLFDGRIGSNGVGSSAHVAKLTKTPVVLCIDGSKTSRTAAAIAHGLATYDPDLRVAGVIFNKVSSPRHIGELLAAMKPVGLEVLGFIPKDKNAQTPSRHLGLIPAEERPEAKEQLDYFTDVVAQQVDLDRLLAIAQSAPNLAVDPWNPKDVVSAPSWAEPNSKPIVAMAGGKAFTFRYAETEQLLTAGGLEVVDFDPLRDASLPCGTAGIYLGGGFPEMFATEIADNYSLRACVADAVKAGVPTVAECAGLLYLAQSLDAQQMTGALPINAAMSERLTMGYRVAKATSDTLLAKCGETATGHEFHRTKVTVDPDLAAENNLTEAWQFDTIDSKTGQVSVSTDGVSLDPARLGYATVHASYLHTHWAGHPKLAQNFISAVHRFHKEHS